MADKEDFEEQKENLQKLKDLKESFDDFIKNKVQNFLDKDGNPKTEFINSPLIQTYYDCFTNQQDREKRLLNLKVEITFDESGKRLPIGAEQCDETKKEILFKIFNLEGDKRNLFERAIIERGRLEGKYTYKQLTCESDASKFLQGLYDNNELFEPDGEVTFQQQGRFQALTTADMVKLITSQKIMQPEMHYAGSFGNGKNLKRKDFKVSYGVAKSGNEKYIIKQVVTRMGGGRPETAMYVLPMGKDKDGNEFVDEKNAIMFFRSDRGIQKHKNQLGFFLESDKNKITNVMEEDIEGYHQHYPTLITSGICSTDGYGCFGGEKENNKSHAISEEKLADYIDHFEGRKRIKGFSKKYNLGFPVKEILESGNNLNIDLTSVIKKVKKIDPEFDKDDEFKNAYEKPESGKGYLLAQSLRVKVAIDKLAAKDGITFETKQKLFNCLEEACNKINSAMFGCEQAKGNEIAVNAEGLKVFDKMGGLYTDVNGKAVNGVTNRVNAENFFKANEQDFENLLNNKTKNMSTEIDGKLKAAKEQANESAAKLKVCGKEFRKITKDMDKNSETYLSLNEKYTEAEGKVNIAKSSVKELGKVSKKTHNLADKSKDSLKINEEAKKAVEAGENKKENEENIKTSKEKIFKQERQAQSALEKAENEVTTVKMKSKAANKLVSDLEKILEAERVKSSTSEMTISTTVTTTKNETKSASSISGKEA